MQVSLSELVGVAKMIPQATCQMMGKIQHPLTPVVNQVLTMVNDLLEKHY